MIEATQTDFARDSRAGASLPIACNAGWCWRRTAPAIAMIMLLLSGCGTLTRKAAAPQATQERATVLGLADVRYWPDQAETNFLAAGEAALEREQALWRASGHEGALPPADLLAISGGGENGAFGAGLLVGWTAAGTRPTFKAVTGSALVR